MDQNIDSCKNMKHNFGTKSIKLKENILVGSFSNYLDDIKGH
jgi:hypothetical protein